MRPDLQARRPLAADTPLRYLAPVFCYVFGVLLLLFVSSPGDGTWQLYAYEILKGKKLYSDLNFPLQPIFPLFSTLSVLLSSGSILAEKIVFLPVLFLFVYFMYKICRLSEGNWIQTSVLMIAVFVTAIHFTGYRFDDYHALAHVGVMASIFYSAKFLQDELRTVKFSAIQSAIISLVMLTKPNDGLALLAVVPILVLSKERQIATLLKAAATGFAVVVVVFLSTMLAISETPLTWFNKAVLAAPSAKGGRLIFEYPVRLYQQSATVLTSVPPLQALMLAIPFPLLLGALYLLRGKRQTILISILLALYLIIYLQVIYHRDLVISLTPFCIFGVTIASAYVLLKTVASHNEVVRTKLRSRLPLLYYPFFLYIVGSLSSGGSFYGIYFPLALTIALVPAIEVRGTAVFRQHAGIAFGFYALCLVVGVQALAYRYANPYRWLSYRAEPYFRGQLFVTSSRRGHYIISRRLLDLVKPVCEQVGYEASLLSLPFSAVNYYCGVPPWRGYVQTFYDISTPGTIATLLTELKDTPPDYVFYQRQLYYLREHEIAFKGGARLQHRDLDEFIMEKLEQGHWKVVYKSQAYRPSTWLLIKTHN